MVSIADEWDEREPWPWGHKTQKPEFRVFQSRSHIAFRVVKAISSAGMGKKYGYPITEKIADLYCWTDQGKWLLYEAKSQSDIRKGLTQLETTGRWLREHGHPVHMLGIHVSRFPKMCGFRRGLDGYLVADTLSGIRVERLQLPIMVQEEGEQ